MMNNFSYKDMENIRSSHSLIDLANLIRKAEKSNGISYLTGGTMLMII